MIRSTKLFQPLFSSKVLGSYGPNLALEPSKYSGSRFSSNTTPQPKHLTNDQALPDPAKAILKYKLFHYSTIGLAICLPASILLPASGLTLATDCILGVVLPTHLFFGLNAVINDYIYQPFVRKTFALGSIIISAVVGLGVLFITSKHESFGTVVRRLWTK
ncbi:hypothetical protein DICPUDRAFT_150238 [Dictyostelium purpureum]|uniref:Succinate dehydrogenase [ubiquinone] cytochrome b small subunit n=1 Tax=Dictyostelium purpureum TaxID=5786 RepID=F0ZFT7_DICPU|nr:uncharacterized protein DICPUDRAFT_150238 [Dictyostelium purpureum]EGC37231.1 hypothetical protein DICPUDRAFT_150238 [Dictyostelium purpureum]|eukprot:XP_003286282.1 hypothetical protein DICPUDRAFT_150238 [Dictyostelium purpureum]